MSAFVLAASPSGVIITGHSNSGLMDWQIVAYAAMSVLAGSMGLSTYLNTDISNRFQRMAGKQTPTQPSIGNEKNAT
jgi:hypothetical protein